MQAKKKRLSKSQQKVIDLMNQFNGSFLRIYKRRSGSLGYRLLDKSISPVTNFRYRTIEILLNIGLLYRDGEQIKIVKHGN